MARSETRTSEQGTVFDAETIRNFIRCALVHDAAADAVHELLFNHVVLKRLHADVVRASLRPLIDEILDAATPEDWICITHEKIARVEEALGKVPSGPQG